MSFKIRKKCLCCKSKNLKEIINIGYHSFADRFIPKKKLLSPDPKYPLVLDLCMSCNFIQSRFITNPKDRYSEYDYSYTSSNSKYSRNHWINFSKFLQTKTNINNKDILEIGSNDGYLLTQLKKFKANVLGIDASSFMVKLSKKKGVRSINAIFNYKESLKIKEKFGKSDIVIANNVFNHSDNPRIFLKGVHNLLKKNGMFIFEQPNFTTGLFSEKFDQIYHEHISYFTKKNIKSILEKSNFKIHEMYNNGYHGGSIRTIAVRKDSTLNEKNIQKDIIFENSKKIYSVNFYKKMFKKIDKKREILRDKINKLQKKGYVIAGIGAGAKANTFLTYFNLDSNALSFLTDSSKFKQNKYTPISRIIIKDDIEIRKYNKIACIILSWNISSLLIKKLKKINNKINFIKI